MVSFIDPQISSHRRSACSKCASWNGLIARPWVFTYIDKVYEIHADARQLPRIAAGCQGIRKHGLA